MNFAADIASFASRTTNCRHDRPPRTLILVGLATALVLGFAASASAQAPGAKATLSTVNSGTYALTLDNTGSTTIGTFWYSWVPGKDFMPGAEPTAILSPPGWTDMVTGSGNSSDGYAIQWTATSSANDLAAGSSLSGFEFDSTLSATQLTSGLSPAFSTFPVGTSVTYTGAPFSSTGDTFVVTQAVPEPSTLALTAVGLIAGGAACAGHDNPGHDKRRRSATSAFNIQRRWHPLGPSAAAEKRWSMVPLRLRVELYGLGAKRLPSDGPPSPSGFRGRTRRSILQIGRLFRIRSLCPARIPVFFATKLAKLPVIAIMNPVSYAGFRPQAPPKFGRN